MKTIGLACTVIGLVSQLLAHPDTELLPRKAEPSAILKESWRAYVSRFMQPNGRVVDPRASDISTSEGQAYAMLRAVWMSDRGIFDLAYRWGRDNLNSGVRDDRLWAWKWGRAASGKWEVLDRAFATDADQDVALALILAYDTWRDERYLDDARAILTDLWRIATIKVDGQRYLLAGDTLCQGWTCRLNPSYCAPYAYRIFAKLDRARPWRELVGSCYHLLQTTARLTATRLPPDWVLLDTENAQLYLSNEKDSSFSYDAFRVYWRVALDGQLFGEPRARRYLSQTLTWLIRKWETTGTLPAVISSSGKALAEYESQEMLAALMPALQSFRPETGKAISHKLQIAYKQGLWGDDKSYYLQNWAWFGTALEQGYWGPFEKFRVNRTRGKQRAASSH